MVMLAELMAPCMVSGLPASLRSMSRTVSISRLAKSSGPDPYRVALALIERGVDIDDPEQPIDGTTHKAARAVIREMLGGPRVVRAKTETVPSVLEPAKRSHDLIGTLSAVRARMRAAWALSDAELAKQRLELLASELERSWPDAASSLREGIEDTLTLMGAASPGNSQRRCARRTRASR